MGNPLAHVRTGPHGPSRQKGLVRGDEVGCGGVYACGVLGRGVGSGEEN